MLKSDNKQSYRGRFAPSPTGPLHFGSLVAAVGSYLDARANNGEWLVRMEDLDPPREVPGAADEILQTLDDYGLEWDGEVVYQSQRHDYYEYVLTKLDEARHIYPCGCTRREIREHPDSGSHSVYPGTCRKGLAPGREARSIRLRVPDLAIRFEDRLQGPIEEWLPQASGDFILKRADGLYAYQLAVVADDAAQDISDIVRGADLLGSTCRQIYLQQLLHADTPRYLHLPVAANSKGEKLSKQTFARAVSNKRPVRTLCAVLTFLGQILPPDIESASLDEFWRFAISQWDCDRLPRERLIKQR